MLWLKSRKVAPNVRQGEQEMLPPGPGSGWRSHR
jgi:hypothetical protein